ncbi:MAG: HD domain-containing protein [Lentisphaerae bacterium]|nr:HD domain-containing protein [Lentisphaerota bacterium]MCP4102012.1 HD domain-containing protein [Lentisphaerota bacterium]
MDFEKTKIYVLNRLRNELPSTTYYHGPQHTLEVIEACDIFATGEKIGQEKTLLLKTAALFHDIGFIYEPLENEALGAKIATEELPRFGYGTSEIKLIARIIMATVFVHKPVDILEEIIRDADLEYVGSDRFEVHAVELRRELAALGRIFTDKEWLDFEICFMKNHKFYTNTCIKMRQGTKDSNLRKLLQARG